MLAAYFGGIFSDTDSVDRVVVENGLDARCIPPSQYPLRPLRSLRGVPPHPDLESLLQRARWRFRPAYGRVGLHALQPTFGGHFQIPIQLTKAVVENGSDSRIPLPIPLCALWCSPAGVPPIRSGEPSAIPQRPFLRRPLATSICGSNFPTSFLALGPHPQPHNAFRRLRESKIKGVSRRTQGGPLGACWRRLTRTHPHSGYSTDRGGDSNHILHCHAPSNSLPDPPATTARIGTNHSPGLAPAVGAPAKRTGPRRMMPAPAATRLPACCGTGIIRSPCPSSCRSADSPDSHPESPSVSPPRRVHSSSTRSSEACSVSESASRGTRQSIASRSSSPAGPRLGLSVPDAP